MNHSCVIDVHESDVSEIKRTCCTPTILFRRGFAFRRPNARRLRSSPPGNLADFHEKSSLGDFSRRSDCSPGDVRTNRREACDSRGGHLAGARITLGSLGVHETSVWLARAQKERERERGGGKAAGESTAAKKEEQRDTSGDDAGSEDATPESAAPAPCAWERGAREDPALAPSGGNVAKVTAAIVRSTTFSFLFIPYQAPRFFLASCARPRSSARAPLSALGKFSSRARGRQS